MEIARFRANKSNPGKRESSTIKPELIKSQFVVAVLWIRPRMPDPHIYFPRRFDLRLVRLSLCHFVADLLVRPRDEKED